MFECLIDYWKTINLKKSDGLIHDADKDLEKNNNQKLEKYKLHLELFPEPFNGNLRKPKIVFLFLNPGYNEADRKVKEKENIKKDVIKAFKQNYTDDKYPFFWLNPDYNECNKQMTNRADIKKDGNPGAYYWNKLFDQKTGTSFLKELAKEQDSEMAREWIAQNVCDIELFPYHSEKFNYSFANCKSADVARCNVFKEIKEHPEVLFVFMRSVKLWTNGCKEWEDLLSNGNVIINPCPRNPSLNPNKGLGTTIFGWLERNKRLPDW